jgi:hypothetical protein
MPTLFVKTHNPFLDPALDMRPGNLKPRPILMIQSFARVVVIWWVSQRTITLVLGPVEAYEIDINGLCGHPSSSATAIDLSGRR